MSPLCVACCSEVALLVAVMVAPITAEPEVSVTVPEMEPVFTWATLLVARKRIKTEKIEIARFICSSLRIGSETGPKNRVARRPPNLNFIFSMICKSKST